VVFQPGERRGLTRGRQKQVRKVLQSMALQRIAVGRKIRGKAGVRQAGFTTPGKAVVAAVIRTPLVRAALRKIPGVSRLVPGSPARIARGEAGLGFAPGTAFATTSQVPGRAAALARRGAQIGAVGGAFAVGEEVAKRVIGRSIFDTGQRPAAPRRQQMAGGRGLAVGQQIPPSHQIVNSWQTFPGGPVFYRLADGHIAVQKKNGVWRHFRPYRPVVIPRKWNSRAMSRVATALKRQRKTATKIMQITGGMPKGRK